MLKHVIRAAKNGGEILLVCFAVAYSMSASCNELGDDSRLSLGMGYGVLFGGIGLNLAQVDENNYRYASLGVISAYSDNYDGQKDSDVAYGFGVGWIKTDIISPDSRKHGLGVYVGAVGADSQWSDAPRRRESLQTRYGGGVNYHYFASGPASPGLVLGGSLLFGSSSGDVKSNVLATLGYRF